MGLSSLASFVPAGLLLAAAWLLAARGYGRLLRSALFSGAAPGADAAEQCPRDPMDAGVREALALGLGIAFLLALESLLGSVGAFRAGPWGRIAAWTVLVAGAAAGLVPRRGAGLPAGEPPVRAFAPWLLAWPALASLSVLLFAAALPPGIAWATEFGGYDALSYHLQLPKEWLERGQVTPLRHSVYSALPGFLECATLHLWTAASFLPVHEVAGAAQWVHAAVCMAAALATGALAASLLPSDVPARGRCWAAVIGTVGLLGIPWAVVTGSLAYNDLGPVLFLATATLAWAVQAPTRPGRTGIAVGLALGAAVGCKPTALGMVVVPFALWAIASNADRRALVRGAAFALPAALLVLLPWLVRNWIAVGNPLFPLAGDAPGWWTPEQVARFAAGHSAPPGTGLSIRLGALWDQAFREGIGAAPGPDPWLPQWGAAFGVGCAAVVIASVRAPRRGLPLLLLLTAQCGFWMFATHLQPRFLLPCTVPLCAAAGIAFAPRAAAPRPGARTGPVALGCALLLAWSLQPWAVLRMDPRMNDPDGPVANLGAIGAAIADLGPGTKRDADALASEGARIPLAWFANWRLPPGAVLGCEGEADVFWIRTTPAWGTVWDGGPLARALRAHPDDPAAAVAAMRAEGLTHLAVGTAMLARWEAAGWLDPALAPARVSAVASLLRPVARTASGGIVYELGGR